MRHFLFSAAMLLAFAVSAEEKSICSDNCVFDPIKLGEEEVEVTSIFAPKGFDANDKIVVLASGATKTPCLRDVHGVVEKVGNDIKVKVIASRWASRDTLCIDMRVPFLISIPIGPTPAGSYNVTVNEGTIFSTLNTQMQIDPPTSMSIDNFLYASVDTISINSKTREIILKGENPSPCMEFVRIAITSNGSNTYAVMPIMKQKEGVICTAVLTPFEYPYQLPNDLQASEILVHVRTLDGNSKNKVFRPQ